MTADRRFTTVTNMVRHNLTTEGCFTLDGSEPIVDIYDAVLDYLLYDHTGHDRMLIEDAALHTGSYEELAEIITGNLA